MRTLVAALALLVLALALRLPHPELAEWKGDEAIQFSHARRIAREHVFPSRGLPTTDGPRLSVHYLYALAIPLVFRDDPEAIRVFLVLLSSLAIVSVFVFGRRDLGARTALATALLLAVLPDEVRRGRWAWHPNLVPPLATFALLAFFRARKDPRSAAGGALVFFSFLLPLVHYALVGVGALSFFVGVLGTKNRRAVFSGLVLGLLVLAPHFELERRNGFRDTKAALAFTREGAPKSPEEVAERSPLVYPRLLFQALALESYARSAGTEPLPFERAVSLGTQLLAVLGVGLGLRSLAKKTAPGQEGQALVFALSAWAPFLLLGLPARHHYVQAAFPALVYLAARALTRVRAAGFLLLPIGWASVLSVRAVLLAIALGQGQADTAYDLPYFEKKKVVSELLASELELVRYERFEYLVLLEVAYRELPEEKRARFSLEKRDVPYWDLSVSIPRPREPRGRAGIVPAGKKIALVEIR